jgi:hypothetical protein
MSALKYVLLSIDVINNLIILMSDNSLPSLALYSCFDGIIALYWW